MYPALKCYFEVHVDGKRRIRRQLSRSFVTAYMRLIHASMVNVVAAQVYDTGHTLRNLASGRIGLITGGAIDVSTIGVVIGSGATAVTPSDYALQTQIVTGNAAGQIRHLSQSYQNPATDATGTFWQVIRGFINNSGGSINVRELGIYGTDNTPNTFMLVRDVLGANVAVGSGQTITVTYTFRADI